MDTKHPLGIATMDLPDRFYKDGYSAEIPGDVDYEKIGLSMSIAMGLAQEFAHRAELHYQSGHWNEAQAAAAVAQAQAQMAQFYQMLFSQHE